MKTLRAPVLLVPGERIELSQSHGPRDFKSLASTSSAIRAYLKFEILYTYDICLSITAMINSSGRLLIVNFFYHTLWLTTPVLTMVSEHDIVITGKYA